MGVYFTFFGSFVFGTPDFPLSDVPLQAIVDKATAGVYKAKPARVFQFDDIREGPRGDGIEPSQWQNGGSNLKALSELG